MRPIDGDSLYEEINKWPESVMYKDWFDWRHRMTAEEAIKIFESWAQSKYKLTHDAAVMAISAIRAQQTPTKLDRSLWEGCPYCTFSLVETDYCGGIKYEWNRGQSLLEYEDSVHIDDKYGGDYCCLIFYDEDNGETEVGIKYCPICGKPLTEEALAELERKIGGNDGT